LHKGSPVGLLDNLSVKHHHFKPAILILENGLSG